MYIGTTSDVSEQIGIKATFMRGGTSKGLFFRWEDMPEDVAERDAFLCGAIGSPDPNGRQLDGMGGGVSSLSKAMMVRRSDREGIDIDYLFAQVKIGQAEVDYGGNCGNLSAAVGAFAVDQGLVQLADGPGSVRMHNENTAKRIDCHLTVRDGRVAVTGDQSIAGVAGQGASIRLDFHDPGGTRTGRLLSGEPRYDVELHDGMELRPSFVDAANPCVFVDARDFGLTATELPGDIAMRPELLEALEAIRRGTGHVVGIANTPEEVPASVPKIALVGPCAQSMTLAEDTIRTADCDVQVRMISMGQPHLAIPLTGAMCTAVAACIPGTVVHGLARSVDPGKPLRIGTASGVVDAFADVECDEHGHYRAVSASVYRTARTLMEGTVYAPMMRSDA